MTEFIKTFKEDEVIDDILKTMGKLEQTFKYMIEYEKGMTKCTVDYISTVVMKDCYDILMERVEEIIENHDI